MPLTIPAGYAECAFVHTHNDTLQEAICTMGVDEDAALNLENVGTAWRDNMLAEMNSIWTYTRFLARVTAGTLVSTAFSTAGAGGGSALSPQVSYLYRKNTVHAGRKGHGRFYYPGCDETSVDGAGHVTGGKVTGLNDQWTAFADELLGLGTPITVFLLHNDATSPYEVTSANAEPVVATQRRRLRR